MENAASARMAGTGVCVKKTVVKDVTGDATRKMENANARLVSMAQPVKSPAALAVLETEAAM